MSKNTNNFEVIKTKLSIDERGSLINRVVNSCFVGTEYHVEMLEPIFQISVMQMFTDKPVITTKATINNEEVETLDYNATYEMIQNDNIFNEIVNSLQLYYIENLHSDVIESLEYKKSQNIAQTSSVSDKIVNSFVGVLDAIRDVVENMDMSKATDIIEMASKMNKAGLNDSGKIIDAIVNNSKNVLANEQKDNVTPIPSPTGE